MKNTKQTSDTSHSHSKHNFVYILLHHLWSKMISNDQELIQSEPTSWPQNQKGNN